MRTHTGDRKRKIIQQNSTTTMHIHGYIHSLCQHLCKPCICKAVALIYTAASSNDFLIEDWEIIKSDCYGIDVITMYIVAFIYNVYNKTYRLHDIMLQYK